MLVDGEHKVQEKVSCLERRVQKQERELVSLRLALAELVRTLHRLDKSSIPYSLRTHGRLLSNSSSESGVRSRGSTPTRVTFSPSLSNGSSSPSPPPSNLGGMKRWSHSQEISGGGSAITRGSNSYSLLNLNSSQRLSRPLGTREPIFNQEEGCLRVFPKGRPVMLSVPSDHIHSYRLHKTNSAPLSQLRLDWVYGYRGRDCRFNLHWLPTGEVVYPAASVVVILNVDEGLQRHYTGHRDEVRCLAVHPNKMIIASGQVASSDRRDRRCRQISIDLASPDAGHWAQVQVWDFLNLHTIQVLGIGDIERAVSSLAFSQQNGGSLLAVVDDSPDHTLSIWDWQKGFKISETKCSMSPVLAAHFHPQDPHLLVTAGRNHVHFWDTRGGSISKKVGIFERSTKPKFVHCVAFTDGGDLVTGDSSNQIMVWSRGTTRVSRVISTPHEDGVYSLLSLKDGSLVSGGKDGRVLHWDHTLERTDKDIKLPDHVGGVRTLTQGKGSRILIGTLKNCILQGTFTFKFTTLIQGHSEDAVVLARHPHRPLFLTAGLDRQMMMWDACQRCLLWSKSTLEVPRSACFSPDGAVLVVGTQRGRWLVMDAGSWAVTWSHLDSVDPVLYLAFSPDGRYLALGSGDRCVYIYETSDVYQKYTRVGRCIGHSGAVKRLDWCVDSVHLQSWTEDNELLFWNARSCRQVTQTSITRDLVPAEHDCLMGFNVYGLWMDGDDPTCCQRSCDGKLLAAGYDSGALRLFSYPANHPKCLAHLYPGHGSGLSQVQFLADGSNILVSSGGRDCTVLQWRVF